MLSLPTSDQIKLIITDVDGTLQNSKHKVSDYTVKVINEVLDKYQDVSFILATGKTSFSTKLIRKNLNIENKPRCPAVHTNGCIIYDDKGKIIHETFLDPQIIIENLQFYEKTFIPINKPYTYFLYCGDICYTTDELFNETMIGYDEDVVMIDEQELFTKLKTGEIKCNKICLFAEEAIIKEFKPTILDFMKNYDSVEHTMAIPICIEVVPVNCNKGEALKYIMQTLNLKPEQVIAFGDGLNDTSMFKVAGWKYAMKNALEELKSIATGVTKSNDEDGEAYILEQIFLKK
ncbi:HAD-like protein [Piromyces finnis]|uniref:HAD-like protein n=1 Tax=Piromyces finnis TaxID=1754191 RepID=A0A1Y1VEP8_9FUNG|nr:HAD-like protein [Piromyces finnis]|eukprot:ORX54324.1 HAD-like protein [Piromyces finnis]